MIIKSAYGFIYNGIEKITYNHYSGNPNGLGKVLMFQLNDLGVTSLDVIKERFDDIMMINDYTKLVNDPDILAELDYYKDSNSPLPINAWYSLVLKAQGSIKPYFDNEHPLKYMLNFRDFLYSSEHCEFAYIVNIDTEMFEIYRGRNKEPNAAGRYSKRPSTFSLDDYAGVKLVAELPLDYIFKMTKEQIMDYTKTLELIDEPIY